MSSDRTRISYDKNQQYRSVVAQQGRVTLESDWNEAQEILSEEIREEALDFVGSNGTPDNGYEIAAINPNKPFDFLIKKGTMYVGGIRTSLNQDITYTEQNKKLDWLDQDPNGFPAWVDHDSLANTTLKNEFIYLYLQEQEISAVEDSALKEIALGGPDTTQRTRLIQKIVRLGVQATDCETALKLAKEEWGKQGLEFDDQTMRLKSKATLKVSSPPSTNPPDLCEPEARNGYLGAENQLIRIQISTKNKLIWGYDNASFLYRVNWIDNQNLQLQSRPVDDFHQPKKDKFVEVLRAAVQLNNGEYIAQATGIITQLTAAYNPDNKQVSLADTIPNTSPLFLRVWEQEIPFTSGVAVTLGDTGIKVIIETLGDFHIGDYWQIAVRPSTPTQVYPQRYLADFQPPDGAKIWVCPLAVISWNDGIFNPLKDCRNRFDNLVELTKRQLGGCCTVIVRPGDLNQNNTLQSIINRYQNKEQVTICLMPGKYQLSEPLILTSKHSNLTIEGCHDGAILEIVSGTEKNFLQGLIVLTYANNVTLRRLRFRLPLVSFSQAGGEFVGPPDYLRILNQFQKEGLRVAIGIRSLHCALLTIEDCLFRYRIPETTNLFAVGIFAGSECWGLKLQGNRFLRDEEYLENTIDSPRGKQLILVGYLVASSLVTLPSNPTTGQPNFGLVPSLLEDASFNHNRFAGLTTAMLLFTDSGRIEIENNSVLECQSGFWLVPWEMTERLGSNILKGLVALMFPLPTNFKPGQIIPLNNSPLSRLPGINRLSLSLNIANNNINTTLTEFPEKDFQAGLVIVGNQPFRTQDNNNQPQDSKVILHSNNICSRVVPSEIYASESVFIYSVDYCAVTGNLIFNQHPDGISLKFTPNTNPNSNPLGVTFTGNVFKGRIQLELPPRPFPEPMNTWEILNTVIT